MARIIIIDNRIKTSLGDTLRITYDTKGLITIERNGEVGEVIPSVAWFLKRNYKTLSIEEIHTLIAFNVLIDNLQPELNRVNGMLNNVLNNLN